MKRNYLFNNTYPLHFEMKNGTSSDFIRPGVTFYRIQGWSLIRGVFQHKLANLFETSNEITEIKVWWSVKFWLIFSHYLLGEQVWAYYLVLRVDFQMFNFNLQGILVEALKNSY